MYIDNSCQLANGSPMVEGKIHEKKIEVNKVKYFYKIYKSYWSGS